ncbi:MAG: iron complex outermembrane receptor protein, partial [Halieaceae bacterium]
MSIFSLSGKANLSIAVSAALLIVANASPVVAQNTLEEIVVTAQKRDQSLQDVPISVAAFDAEMLDNMVATDIGDIAAFTPNVSIGTGQATQPSLSIRGIGTSDFGVGLESAVGVYIDGVYIGRSGAANLAFNDIQRVEILNGPQGTLFGRNAAAGAVQYITNKPNQETEGWMKLTLGNYGKTQLEGVYNTPLTDNLALRASALMNQRDGYIEDTGDDRNDEDNWGVIASLLWTPTDRLEVLWRVEYDEINQTSRADSSATLGPRDNGADFDKIENDGDTREWRDLFGTSLHVKYDLVDVVFNSITSYRTFESFNRRDKDGSAEARYFFDDLNYEDNTAFSQEWRFESATDGPLQWVAGANYFRENAEQIGGAFFS